MTPTCPGAEKKEVVKSTRNLFAGSVKSGVGLAHKWFTDTLLLVIVTVSVLYNLMTFRFNSD